MNKSPLVSICMITYNHAEYIEDAILGVLKQKCNFRYELIIADDSSPDNTQEIVEQIISNYRGKHIIKYTRHLQNKGMNANSIWSINQTCGKYIAFCEGDDYWIDSLKLQKQVDFLKTNLNYRFCYTDFSMLYEKTGVIHNNCFKKFPKKYREPKDQFDFLINKMYVVPCSWLFEKSLFKGIDLSGNHSDATFYMILEFMNSTKLGFLPDCTVVYRVLEESASNTKSYFKKALIREGLLKTQLEFINKMNLNHDLRKVVENDFYKDICGVLLLCDDKEESINIINYISTNYDFKKFNEILLLEAQNRLNNLTSSVSYKIGLKFVTFVHKLVSVFKKSEAN